MITDMSPERIRNVIEAALLAAGRPLSLDVLVGLFQPVGQAQEQAEDGSQTVVTIEPSAGSPGRDDVRAALDALMVDYRERGIELREVSSGYRIQVRPDYAEALRPLWSERPARYSRALLETLALIAYRQPITRGEIEDIRGVSVSSSIVKTLLEREWVRVVGHRDVPGKPAMYGTTRQFLDYFSLKTLAELPTLAEIRDIDEITGDLFPNEVTPEDAEKTEVTDTAGGDGHSDNGDEHVAIDTEAGTEAGPESEPRAARGELETETDAEPAEAGPEEDRITAARILAPET